MEAGMEWLGLSIVVSVVLTIVLNVALRVFPDAADRLREHLFRLAERSGEDLGDSDRRSGVRVIVPWKAMLVGSLVLTLAINLLVHLR
jgi:hypothetical protein